MITVIDGDEAGVKYRKDIQNYLGNRKPPVQFEANRNFVSVRSGFSVEGLFPDRLIKDLYKAHPSYFTSYSEDAQGEVEPFQLSDNQKAKAQNFMLSELVKSNSDSDFARFKAVFIAANKAITALSTKSFNPGVQ